MQFKRFLEINNKDSNDYIIFNNHKILYEPNLKTFLLNSSQKKKNKQNKS